MTKIMKGTTLGVSEIAGVAVADVFLDAVVPHVWIRPNANPGPQSEGARTPYASCWGRSRSNETGHDHPAGHRCDPKPQDAPKRTKLRYFDKTRPSTYLNNVLHDAGIPHPTRLSAYSLRHTMKQALIRTGGREDLRRYLMGHTGKDSHDRYGSPTPLLREARDMLLAAIPLLGQTELSDYRPEELMKARP